MSISTNFPAIKPSLMLDFANTGSLDPRITFSRASTGTYYDGVTAAKAEENLLQYSQEFNESYYQQLRSTVSANATTAPDGTSTADALTQATGQTTSGAVYLAANIAYSASTYIFSVFAKPNGKDFIRLAMIDGGSTFRECYFDVNNGTVGTASNGAVGTITASANGYYRCSVAYTFSSASTMNPRIFLADTNNSSTVVDSGGLYIWGAQLEQRSSVTAYTPTTTQPITNYIPVLETAASDVARFDHNPTTFESLGLLIEEQRTNVLTYSSEFDNAAWTKTNATITANTVVAPDGTLTGDKLVEDTNTGSHQLVRSISFVSGTTYSLTFYAKASERNRVNLQFPSSAFTSPLNVNFDLLNGTVISAAAGATASIVNVGNGWYRCQASATATVTITANSVIIRLIESGTTASYTGDGYSGIFIWGAQLEAGAFPTSYIATTSAQVTRSADAASMTGTNFSSWYNQGEGALYSSYDVIGYNPAAASSFPVNVSVSDGTSSNYIALLNTNYGSNLYGYPAASVAGIAQYSMYGGTVVSFSINTLVQACVSYAVNNALYSVNGLAAQSDTTCLVPIVNKLNIGVGASGSLSFINGHIRKISYYPQALTAANLQALTS